jgi:hypothetical protein
MGRSRRPSPVAAKAAFLSCRITATNCEAELLDDWVGRGPFLLKESN